MSLFCLTVLLSSSWHLMFKRHLSPVFLASLSSMTDPWWAVGDMAMWEVGGHFGPWCLFFPPGGFHGFPECGQACFVWWLHEVSKHLVHHQGSPRRSQKRLWGHILCLYSSYAMTKPIEWGDFTSAEISFFCWYFPSSSTAVSKILQRIQRVSPPSPLWSLGAVRNQALTSGGKTVHKEHKNWKARKTF